jgi:FSR family fosmidomycin resistance protein-like MFS transporter
MKEKKRILSTVSLYHALDDGAISVIPLLFPVLKILFDLSYTQIGFITGGGLLITLIGEIFIGHISDSKNFRIMLASGILLISVSMLLLTQAYDFITLVLFIFILRLAASFFHPIGIGWISKTFKKDRLDWAMGIQSGFGDIGAFIAVLTTLYLVELRGWKFPLFIWSIFGILILLSGLFLTRSTKIENTITINKDTTRQKFEKYFEDAKKFLKRIKILIPAFILSGATWSITISYLPLLLNERTNLSLPYIGFLISVWLGIGSIVSFFYGRIYSLIGRKNVILFAYLTIGIVGFSLSYFTNTIMILILMILLGISTFLTYPALFSFVSSVTLETTEGKSFGYIFTIQLGGGTLLLVISGVLSDLWGIWVPFTILGITSITLTVLLFVYRKKPIVVESQ